MSSDPEKSDNNSDLRHHIRFNYCRTRPLYRKSKRPTAVKVSSFLTACPQHVLLLGFKVDVYTHAPHYSIRIPFPVLSGVLGCERIAAFACVRCPPDQPREGIEGPAPAARPYPAAAKRHRRYQGFRKL